MAIDRTELQERLSPYFDPDILWEEVVANCSGPIDPAGRFNPVLGRQRILAAPDRGSPEIKRYSLLPFDNRWCYWTAVRPLWNEPRPELVGWINGDTRLFIARMNAERPNEHAPAFVTCSLPDCHLLRPNVVAMPIHLNGAGSAPVDLLGPTRDGRRRANLSSAVRAYLADVQLPNPDEDIETAELVWLHALAICYSPAYLSENEDGVKRDFPRIPLPRDAALLRNSARIGGRVAGLLDIDAELDGVTRGTIAPYLRPIGSLTRSSRERGPVNLNVTVRWGYAGRDGVITPGGGRTETRPEWPAAAELETAIRSAFPSTTEPLAPLGRPIDAYLNDQTFWTGVPEAVWDYRIGGYQVIKKWLSYRSLDLLGRPLSVEESRHVTNMARRLSIIVLMTDELNANYAACNGIN